MRLVARPGATPLGLAFLACAVIIGAAVGLLHLDHLPVAFCAFKAVTGHPCLTCGTTRALARLVRLDVPGAMAMNPMTATAALATVPWGMADLALLRRGSAVGLEISPRWAPFVRVAAIVLAAANWAYLIAAGR